MSSSWFGLGGFSPGGTTPILPFGLPFQAGGAGVSPFALPTFGDAAGGGGGSIFGSIVGALPGLLSGLSQAGIIRGSVGEFFAPQMQQMAMQPFAQMASVGGILANPTLQQIFAGAAGGVAGGLVNQLTGGAQVPALPGACGPRGAITLDPMSAAGLYRQSCSGTLQTRPRFFALRPDGTRDLFVKVGKVQSVSQRTLTSFARRWAKEAGLTATKRGRGVARRARRRPR